MSPNEHIDEKTISLYVLNAPEVDALRNEIELHLTECAGCAELCEAFRTYYAKADQVSSLGEERVLPRLLSSAGLAKSDTGGKSGMLTSLRRSLLIPLVESMRLHPVRWSGALALVIVGALLLFPKSSGGKNPAFAHAKDEFLVAMDQNGGELWRAYVAPGFEAAIGHSAEAPQVMDIDGDGRREIITTATADVHHSWISCFEADGRERWRFEFHPEMVYGTAKFSGDYLLETGFDVGIFGSSGTCQIAFAVHHAVWWPSAIGLLDASNGTLESVYWHPGWVHAASRDVDGDGRKELIVAGINNAYGKNAVAILDSRYVSGHAPGTANYIPQGVQPAAEKFYLLLPNPDLFELAPHPPPVATAGARIQGVSTLEIRTTRFLAVDNRGERALEVFFDFDSKMKCVEVRCGDEFIKVHDELRKQGKVKTKLDAVYLERLRLAVLYWDGEKFVKEPTMNRRYLDLVNVKGD